MTEFVFVKPAEGGRIRMPDRNSTVMSAEGMFVPRSEYYQRLIMTGDLMVDEAKKFEAPKPEEKPAQAEEKVIEQPPATRAAHKDANKGASR